MFKLNLTLSKRIAVLGILLAGLFVVSSYNNKVGAVPCCFPCDNAYAACAALNCPPEDHKPWSLPLCLAAYCEPDYQMCGQFCEIEPGVFGCQHPL